MVEGIIEKKLGDFQEFEEWIDEKHSSIPTYYTGGMQKAHGDSKAHYTDIASHYSMRGCPVRC